MKTITRSVGVLSFLYLLSVAGVPSAFALDRFWAKGTGTFDWSDPANWSGGLVASGTDRALIQNSTNTDTTSTITFGTDAAVNVIQIQTVSGFSGKRIDTFSGTNTLTINQSISVNQASSATFNTNVTMANPTFTARTISASGTASVINFGSGYTLAGGFYAGGIGTINLNSSVFNTGADTTALRLDAGTVNWNVGTFSSTSTSSGLLSIIGQNGNSPAAPATLNFLSSYSSAGGIVLGHGTGDTSDNVAVYGVKNGVTIAARMSTNGAGTSGAAVNTITLGANDTSATSGSQSTVTFSGNYGITDTNARTHQFFAAENNTAIFSGTFSGGSASNSVFKKTGLGTVIFSGAGANLYNAAISTEVAQGTLVLQKASGVALTSGTVTVDSGATLQVGGASQLSGSSSLFLPGGTFDLQGFNQTLGGVQLTNSGTLAGSGGTLTSTSAYDFQAGTVSANLAGAVALNKTTGGTVTLGGVNGYTGATTVSAGKLIVNGSITSSATTVNGDANTTLSGNGAVAPLVSITAGRIAPGLNVSGSNTNFGAAGTLQLGTTGGLTLTNASLDFDLASTAAGASDQIVTGALSLGSTIAFTFNGLAGASSLETGVNYILISSSSLPTGFNAGNITTTFVNGDYTATYSLIGNGLAVQFAVIPEPQSWVMILSGLGMLVSGRQMRRRPAQA